MVANYTSSRPPYYLPFLDEEESWKLFCQKVFLGEECRFDLEPIGRSIIESCQGLPLAIVALAGLVAKKKRSEREWLKIKDYVHWHLTQNETKVMDVVKISYESLPERLKPCFLFFGIYHEDYEIPARELIRLWIAEDFIQTQESGIPNAPEPEDVGEEYLNELIDRNSVHVLEWRSAESVKAHNFFQVCTQSNINSLSSPSRLSLLCNAESSISSIKCNRLCTRSSFIFSGESFSDDALENFKSVQVLYLAGIEEVPGNLKVMIFLRYLKVEGTWREMTDPDCIWSLSNLETLDLRGAHEYNVNNNFWKLQRLRHFYMRIGLMFPEDKQESNSKTMWNLRTLSKVDFDPPMAFLFSSDSFPNLRKLDLYCDREEVEKSCSLNELLWGLQHLSNLRALKIHCCGSELSLDATMFPSNLTKITLSVFVFLALESMKALGRLPNLQILKIWNGILPETLGCAVGEFPHLQLFEMEMVLLNRWMLEEGAMPRLRKLVLRFCYGFLSELPEQLWSLTTLQGVQVVDPSDELENSLQNVAVSDNCNLTVSYMYKKVN